MACLNTLKLEIKTVEQIFTKTHERFQVLFATVDELTCRFIGPNNRRYDIHANITVSIVVHNFRFNDPKSCCLHVYQLRIVYIYPNCWSCPFQETYPSTPPVWFAETEETTITNAIQLLSNTHGRDNHLINQVSVRWGNPFVLLHTHNAFRKTIIIRRCFTSTPAALLLGWHSDPGALSPAQLSTATRSRQFDVAVPKAGFPGARRK